MLEALGAPCACVPSPMILPWQQVFSFKHHKSGVCWFRYWRRAGWISKGSSASYHQVGGSRRPGQALWCHNVPFCARCVLVRVVAVSSADVIQGGPDRAVWLSPLTRGGAHPRPQGLALSLICTVFSYKNIPVIKFDS